MTSIAFTDAHAAFLHARPGASEWLTEQRLLGIKRFKTVGLPTRQHEDWKYTSLKPVAEFRPATTVEPTSIDMESWLRAQLAPVVSHTDITLVTVNGQFSTAFSSPLRPVNGVRIHHLTDVLAHADASLQRLVTSEPDVWLNHPFAALSQAFLDQGVLIEVERDCAVEPTIHLIHVSHTVGSVRFPRTVIKLARGARAQVAETFLGTPAVPYFVGSRLDLDLAENAALFYAKAQREGDLGLHSGLAYARLSRDAQLYAYAHMQGGRLIRNDLAVELAGQGANVTLDGLYLARGTEHVDNHTVIDHKVAHTTSSQTYKGVLTDHSRAVFNGRVFVRQAAQQTNAHQLNRNLLLSSDAEIDTKPELLIDANDVKCSHGATVGQLRRDEIFYLQSRGLTRDQAIAMLSEAFAEEIALRLPHADVRRRLRAFTKEWLSP